MSSFNVPFIFRITSLPLTLSANTIFPFGQTVHPTISFLFIFPFLILSVEFKVILMSLMDFGVGCSMAAIICDCFSFSVISVGELVSIYGSKFGHSRQRLRYHVIYLKC